MFFLAMLLILLAGLLVWLYICLTISSPVEPDQSGGRRGLVISPEAQAVVDTMTIEQKVGQLMMVGFWGTTPDAHIRDVLSKGKAGGVIFLKYNVESDAQVRQLTSSLNSLVTDSGVGVPLLIAVDQEGGTVVRVRTAGVQEFTAQSDIVTDQQAYQVALSRGAELQKLGITVNFSPVLDVIDSRGSFLYPRVFRSEFSERGPLGEAMVRGYRDAGILAVPKHFPGHTDDMVDSHTALPSSDASFETVKTALNPFVTVLKRENPEMLMTGHVVYTAIDPDYPASLSSIWLGTYLRHWIGYQGVVITDDLEMGAIMNEYTSGEAAVRAIVAGSDMVLFVSSTIRQDEAYQALLAAVQEGSISMERLDQSVGRIVMMKMGLGAR